MTILQYIKNQVSFASRNSKSDHFYSLFREGMLVLDAGVSFERNVSPSSSLNHFLKTFKYDPKYYIGFGIEDLSQMDQLYPGKRFVEYSGGRFPFDNKEFDWVYSNAVIEHVGNDDAQLMFLNEMMRVGKNVFFTTPNKFFPIETHTNVLILHWNDNIFHHWCNKRHKWVSKYNPYLFSYSRLKKMLKSSKVSTYKIYKNRFCGLVMTFTVVCSPE